MQSRFLFHLLLVASIMALVCGAAAQTPAPQTIAISGKILGASGKHPVYVALWDEAGFLRKPVQQLRIDPQQPVEFQFHVPPGAWALSAFEDENEDGILNMGVFGPKEPSGFWRAFHQWRKPRFADVASTLNQDTPNADIQLH